MTPSRSWSVICPRCKTKRTFYGPQAMLGCPVCAKNAAKREDAKRVFKAFVEMEPVEGQYVVSCEVDQDGKLHAEGTRTGSIYDREGSD